MPEDFSNKFQDFFKNFDPAAPESVQYYWIIGASILVPFLLWIIKRAMAGTKHLVAFQDEKGKVHVSQKALRDLIGNTCENMPDVKSSKPEIKILNKGLQITLHLKLNQNADLKRIRNNLQVHLESTLKENLGFENHISVDIVVDEIQAPEYIPEVSIAESVDAKKDIRDEE